MKEAAKFLQKHIQKTNQYGGAIQLRLLGGNMEQPILPTDDFSL